jgi:outer membrane cobalamin receptor
MKILYKIFIFIAVFVLGLKAQSMTKISGFVYAEDGHPLENVNVVVEGTTNGAATDSRGYFEIGNIFSGEYTITVSHVNYEKISRENVIVARDIPVRLTFHLRQIIGTLEEISVSAQRDSSTDSVFKIKLSSEQIRNASARTLGELLIQIPGIDIIDEGAGGQKKISIRGSNPNQVLVLLDGIPLNDPLTGEADLNLVPISIIENVTIHKGGNAAKSGGGAFAGQVEITSRQLFKNELSAGVNGGSFNSNGGRASLSGTLGHFSLFLTYDYQTEKGDFPYTYQELDGTLISERRLNAAFTSEQFFLKTRYHNSHHQVILQANIYNSERGLPGTIFFWTPYASANVKRNVAAAIYKFITTDLIFSLQTSVHQNISEYRNLWPEDPPLKYRRVPPYHTNYQLEAYQGDATTTWQWSDQNNAVIQLYYRKDLFKDEDILSAYPGMLQEANNIQTAIGIENNWRFLPSNWIDHSSLKFAFRYDNVRFENQQGKRTDTHLSPKIGFLIGDDGYWLWNIQTNVGRSFRSPTFADLYYQDFRVKGNATLLPEKSIDFDVGFRFGIPWIGQPEFAASYFRQKIENLIVWELGSFATWQPTNLNAEIDGMEYDLSLPVWQDHLIAKLNHLQLNARNRSFRHTTHDKLLIYRPEKTTRIDFELKYNRLMMTYQKRMVSKRYVTAANTVSLPAYQVDDLTLRVSFSSGPLKWNLRAVLLNMFNTRYEIVRDAPLPGRHWRVGLDIVY